MNLHIGIIGATGIIGYHVANALNQMGHKLSLFASAQSQTRELVLGKKIFSIQTLTPEAFNSIDIAIFSSSATISKKWASVAINSDCRVIDLSDAFRLKNNVPLFFSYSDPEDIKNIPIISCPNCTTSLISKTIYPLHQQFELKKLYVSTYQSVSGAGKRAVLEWEKEFTNPEIKPYIFPETIANNCIPYIGKTNANGQCQEEKSIIKECRKLFNQPKLKISATCVRISCERGHGIALTAQFKNRTTPQLVINELSKYPDLIHQPKTPRTCKDRPEIYYSRVRKDFLGNNSVSMWIVGDQIVAGTLPNIISIVKILSEN